MDAIGNGTSGGILGRAFNNVTDSIVCANESDRLASRGQAWTSRRVLTVPSGLSNIYFDPTAAIGQNKLITILPPIFTAIGGNTIILTTFVGSTYTGGTPQIIFNRNQNVGGSPLSVIVFNGTLATPGVEGAQFSLLSSATGPMQNTTGLSTSQILLVLNENVVTRIQVDNTDTASALLEYNITFSEYDA